MRSLAITMIGCVWLLTGCERWRPAMDEPPPAIVWIMDAARSDDPSAAHAIAERIRGFDWDERACRAFASLLFHENPVVRRNIAMAVAHAEIPVEYKYLRRAMDDGESQVRRAALRAVNRVHPEKSRFLCLLSLKDTSWFVRAEALDGIGRMGRPGDIRRVARLLGDEDDFVRYDALNTLCQFARDGHVDAVLDAIRHYRERIPPDEFRRAKLIVETATDSRCAAEALLEEMASGDWTRSELAIKHLARGFPDLVSIRLRHSLEAGEVPEEHLRLVRSVVGVADSP